MGSFLLNRLPDEIYPLVKLCLSHNDYHYFLNSSKAALTEIKRKTITFTLTKSSSKLFLQNKEFRERIYSLVSNPSDQICISLDLIDFLHPSVQHLMVRSIRCRADNGAKANLVNFPVLPCLQEIFLSHFHQIKILPYFNNVRRVTISDCKELIDISSLEKSSIVSLRSCDAIEDFHLLGKQEKLDLGKCTKLMDVNNLANVYQLSLTNCPLLKDISPLCNVPILSLSDCPLIRDLSPLFGNHKELKIHDCHYHLEGYHVLQNIPKVSLKNCNIVDLRVLSNAQSVILRSCEQLVYVHPLRQVKSVTLECCPKVFDISSILHVPELTIGELPAVGAIGTNESYSYNFSLTYTWSNNLFTFAPHIHRISIFYNAKIEFFLQGFLNFTSLQYLFISHGGEFSTEGFADIPHIIFYLCSSLQDISGLGRNRRVRLDRCREIRDVSSLRTVPIVTIINCPNIENYCCLVKVPRLKVCNIE